MNGFPDQVNEDVMQNIFSRLSASSFASAACVNKYWNNVCTRFLEKPKIASALSINPSLPDALKEVFDKVLSEPIRPHFAIACISSKFSLESAHQLLTERLGSNIPIITNTARGIIGVEALTDELKEVMWESDPNSQGHNSRDGGIVLIIGSFPGLKVNIVPLLRPRAVPHISLVEDFVRDVEGYTSSVSDCRSPVGIVLFGDQNVDMRHILAQIDHAMPEETVIVGGTTGCYLFGRVDGFYNMMDTYFIDAVALVLAEDRHKPQGVGKVQFHVKLSTGLMPFGPKLKVACVEVKGINSSWLTASMEGKCGILDWKGLLDDLKDQFEEDEEPAIYMGAIQQMGCKSIKSLAFYEVVRGEDLYLVVNGVGIKPGDSFLLYHSDPDTAASSCVHTYESLATLKKQLRRKNRIHLRDVAITDDRKEVVGGFIFSCYRRSESFFGQSNVDSFPFCENFPGVPLAGVLCSGEIGRGSASSVSEGLDAEENSACSTLHVYSTVYLVVSYLPAPCTL